MDQARVDRAVRTVDSAVFSDFTFRFNLQQGIAHAKIKFKLGAL